MIEKKTDVNMKGTDKPNRDKINLSELYEIQDWSKKFRINTKDIRRAVAEAWNNALDFEHYKKNRRLRET